MSDRYDQLALAIGHVCSKWAYLETIVHDMALHLAAYQDVAYDEESVRHPLHIALSHMKLRERILVVKALAHAVAPPSDYYDRLARLLSFIDADLTIERNRFVHDSWSFEGERLIRFAPGPKVIRPQSHLRELVMGTEKEFESIEQVRLFIDRLQSAIDSLVDLENELAGLIETRERPRG